MCNRHIAVKALSICPRSLSDKNWEGPTSCPCLSMLNYGKNQCRSDKTVILNALIDIDHNWSGKWLVTSTCLVQSHDLTNDSLSVRS